MKRAILPPSLMVTSIIGFIVSAIYTSMGQFSNWFSNTAVWGENFGISLGFSFCLVFILMFIASMISLTPTDEELGT